MKRRCNIGTRAITTVLDEDGKKIIEMYTQSDGYPEGLGQDLKDFISSGTMVNGLGGDTKQLFNGIGCFAAQLVNQFKSGAGGTYLHVPTPKYKSKKKYGEMYFANYYYEIWYKNDEFFMECWNTDNELEFHWTSNEKKGVA